VFGDLGLSILLGTFEGIGDYFEELHVLGYAAYAFSGFFISFSSFFYLRT